MKWIIGLPLLVVGGALSVIARGWAREYREELQLYQFKLPILADLGFWLLAKLHIPWSVTYLRKTRGKLTELYGARQVEVYLEVHIAQKIVMGLAGYLIFDFLYLVGDTEVSFLVVGLLVGGLLFLWPDQDLQKKVKLRKESILIDLPGFLNSLVLLVSAGLPFGGAVQKVVGEASMERPLYRELSVVLAEQGAGKPISQSYEDLAHRCKVPEITRMVSTIIQNLHRGSGDLVHILHLLAQEAWERRKDIAKRQGEEASSKLVIPMVMVFLAVVIIVIAPAIITMSR